MLSPSAEEIVLAHNRAEQGKRKAEVQKSSNSELFPLLIDMREEMKRRDEQLKEELRWRDNNHAIEDKKRKERMAALLQ